jgi:hypothetical protein
MMLRLVFEGEVERLRAIPMGQAVAMPGFMRRTSRQSRRAPLLQGGLAISQRTGVIVGSRPYAA